MILNLIRGNNAIDSQGHRLTRPLGSLIWWVSHMCERFHHNKGPTSKRVYKGEEVREEGGGGVGKIGV